MNLNNQKGVIALMTVLIILAIILVLGVGLGLRSISEMKMSLRENQSSQAHHLANLCVEQALMNLKENSNYAGNETIIDGNGQCTIMPIEGSWVVKTSATYSGQVRKMKIVVSIINPEMIISSWEELSDF